MPSDSRLLDAVRIQLPRSQIQGASSIVDASRRASSRSDVGHLPHSRPDIEVTTDFRQWNILSERGAVSTKRRSSQMRAINMRLITSFSSTFARLTRVVSKSVQDPPCSFSATAISKGECSVWTIIVLNEAHSHRSLLHTGDSKSRLTRHRFNLFHLGPNGSCIVFLVSVMRSWRRRGYHYHSVTSLQAYTTSDQTQVPGCGREVQARHDLWSLQRPRTQPSYM
ncbi:BQ5605_C017g08425 [Microbotryum silenes-dioicae]|uniref:BQ5605_C017g08425 protein n=1 Tax=Microbotryum silenes-dioicae TaxID=796604 RepID=A0A2X0LYM8_9BASI|nr:BQ5605_C017g08425 [Microbotryum silenes-dioicae]